ncbi:bifunctional helix-turn-helix transcriptional regulator/GNAT family N-acetyltransferase [Roseofilum sp. Guam]|uniref:bifunctional helix-turn-helix transcriptional regulator/GNAT family N-acetyltransferase n=1 Tax=Roseofilum sp. Guam TaxID=2821502 RepID=UPI001B2CEB17|nr:bifunctional helix-turn-helix transcriptional regulator/GNAT family N-acetyltransferase [Roseofilum sp. Guam]MBP0031252.1 bifunctional helix-turn-helix transcriptional regulator/GNAT family N-acetyltransferase [Roseofilum sp. Guam]
MDFYSQLGKVALGSRLRRLSDCLAEDAAKIYTLYNVDMEPKWFPVFYVLSQKENAAVTEIAQMIGRSHASVSQIVREMSKRGIVTTEKHSQDARVSVVRLSDAGKQLIPGLEQQCHDVNQAVEELLSESQHDLWNAIAEVEFLLADRSFWQRVRAIRKIREQKSVEIIDYLPEFHDDFKRLNYEWIEKYFQIEECDRQSLNHPDEKILKLGGYIFMARYNGEIVGACALIKSHGNTYELAKMAVTEKAQGKGIGWLLGQAAINKARELRAETIFLESNTILKPAINLYQKLGFRKVVGQPSPYQRCNIQMELKLV